MNSKNILNLIIKYKLSFIIIVLLAGICALVFSSKAFITPLYKSTVVLYPTSTYSVSKSLFNTNKLIFVDPLEIGNENQTDQMLQILNSNIIRDKIIEKYDLMNHYGIKENQKYKFTHLYKEYKFKIKFHRTEYNAVLINVLDSDPHYAMQIANDMATLFDSTMNSIQKDYAMKALEIVENEYNLLNKEKNILEDSLKTITKNGIYNYDIQINTLSEQLAIEISKGNNNGVQNIEKRIDEINKYKEIIEDLNIKIAQQRQDLSLIKSKYNEAKIDATQTIPHKFVVTSAVASEKPYYPIRWIIVTITMISTFLLLILIVIFIEYFSEQKLNKNG